MAKDFSQELVDILRCSHCQGKLTFIKDQQKLQCEKHGDFPIINGIPSFAKKHDFDSHWDNNYCEQISSQKKNIAQEFLKPLFEYTKIHNTPSILDAGCGDGVHVKVLSNSKIFSEGSMFVGVDISFSALHAIRKRKHSNWEFVHADISKLPFENGLFDVVFSFGVLAYTDDPYHSFSELCRVVRKGGMVGVWLYPKTRGIKGALFSFVRKTCQLAGPLGRRLIADSIVLFLGLLPTSSGLSLRNATWRQCREVVLVNIAPKNLIFPESSEVENWFSANNIKITHQDDTSPITIWGIKK